MEVAASRNSSVRYTQAQKLNFVWTIKHFLEKVVSNEQQDSNDNEIILTSPVKQVDFETRTIAFRLEAHMPLMRNGGYAENDSLSLCIVLDSDDHDPEEMKFHVSAIIRSASGHYTTDRKLIFPHRYGVDYGPPLAWKPDTFISMRQLMSYRDDLLQNDPVTIICRGTIYLDLRWINIIEPNFMSNFEGIWLSGSGSDAVLVAEGKEFLVHRVVLQARSPVFEAMFNNDTTEKRTGRVVIEDMDPPLLETMIRFIYTDEEPSNLPEIGLAADLMVAAGRYGLERLQSMCECYLASTLNLDNVMPLLKISISHSCHRLKRDCCTFVKLNHSSLRKDPHWERAVSQEYQHALKELLEYMLGQHTIDTDSDGKRTMEVAGEEDSLVRYEQREKFHFVWTIEHFEEKLSNHRQDSNEEENTLTSPVHQVAFGTDGMRFHLKATIPCLKNDASLERQNFGLSLYYELDVQAHDVTSHSCSAVTIKSASGCDYTRCVTTDQEVLTASNSGLVWEYKAFISMNELMSRRDDLLPKDTMTIICQGKFDVNVRLLKSIEPNFMRNFSRIMKSGSGSDAVLVAQEKGFLVHRVVLQARSPVFEAMFNHDTTEKRTGRVVIEDMDPPVLQAMILFIYTDQRPRNLPEIATNLMVAASRYGLERLQNMCENQLAKSINLENIMSLLNISACYSCPKLKRACCTFATLNSNEMRKASYWGRNLVQEYPDAVMELLDIMKITPNTGASS